MNLESGSDNQFITLYDEGEQRFLDLIDALPKISVQGYDKERRVIYWNHSSEEIYGYSKQDAIGRKLEELIIPAEMKEAVIALHQQWLQDGVAIPSERLQLKRKDGSLIHVFSSHVMLKEGTDNPEMFCIDVDLSKENTALQELERMASTDLLTGLPNRRFLYSELQSRIAEAKSNNSQFAVLFIDLDMFKEVNDTLGHTWGDELLRSVAKRLEKCLSNDGKLTRFGGDEFVIVLNSDLSQDEVSRIASKLTDCFGCTFELGTENAHMTVSTGVSNFPQDGSKPDDLLKKADVAMYQAKAEGRNQFQFFSAELFEKVNRQRTITAQLHESFKKDEFMLVYQPQFDLRDQHVAACEALLRWCPADASRSVPPNIFIGIAERTDLIVKIGQWVLEQACKQVKAWKEKGIMLRVDINISGKELIQPNFFSNFESTIRRFGLLPSDLGIELTENLLIQSDDSVLEGLRALRAKGVEIAIDDFGVGYSSLSYLRQFPISHLKIDRSFLKHAPEDPYDGALLEAIINMGHKLELNIVAEGIETQEQSNYCKHLNVEYAQGFLFSKPLAPNEIEKLLAKK